MKITTLLNDAFLEIGVISAQDEAMPEDSAFALRTLNRIVDTANAENLITSYVKDVTYEKPETGWTSNIEIGRGLQYDQVAPNYIEHMFFRQNGTDYPLRSMTSGQWAGIGFKEIESIPYRFYAQIMEENALKIYFDAIPQDNLELHILSKAPINDGVDFKATDDIIWNYGVEKMILTRLALELCPTYEIQASNELMGKAQDAENAVKSRNYQPRVLKADKSLTRKGRNTPDVRNRARY